MDVIYAIEDDYTALLSVMYTALKSADTVTDIQPVGSIQTSLHSEIIYPACDPEKADIVENAVARHISPEALGNVYFTYLSDNPRRFKLIYDYLRAGFKYGASVDQRHQLDCVAETQKTSKAVGWEIHRLTGFIRFKLVNGVYYSVISPDNNILECLAPHFADRMSDTQFIIYDEKRRKICLYSKGEYRIVPDTEFTPPEVSAGERETHKLWKTYFDTIAIESRLNPRCQRQHLPVRYWRHLTEMERM